MEYEKKVAEKLSKILKKKVDVSKLKSVSKKKFCNAYVYPKVNPKYFVKFYHHAHDGTKNLAKIKKLVRKECASLIDLKKYNLKGVKTADVVGINGQVLVLKFIKELNKSKFLAKSKLSKTGRSMLLKKFEKLGEYIAKYHNKKKGYVHGDFTFNNILFTKEACIVLDPIPQKKKVYFDVKAMVSSLLELEYIFLLGNRNEIISTFVKSYEKHIKIDYSRKALLFNLKRKIENHKIDKASLTSLFYSILNKINKKIALRFIEL